MRRFGKSQEHALLFRSSLLSHKERLFIPWLKRRGFQARLSVNPRILRLTAVAYTGRFLESVIVGP